MRNLLVEYARLNRVGRLGQQQAFFQALQGANRRGAQPEGQHQRAEAAGERHASNGNQQTAQADARSMQRDDFAVGGEPTQADQHPDQHRHRDGEGQHGRQRTQKYQRDGEHAAGMADHQIHQADELRHEENESKDSEAQDGVRADFATDVFIEEAHDCAWRF